MASMCSQVDVVLGSSSAVLSDMVIGDLHTLLNNKKGGSENVVMIQAAYTEIMKMQTQRKSLLSGIQGYPK